MPVNQATTQLVFANVQMAAEATRLNEVMAGTLNLEAALLTGNNRNSVFTAVDAAQFAREWAVVAHRPNTDAGFSGTLFRFTGETDPGRGLVNGQLVMSFRSTEFIDDAVRDTMATNNLEISEHGWAFGQIADMKRWVDSLYANNSIGPSQPLAVTGYSLGGHLATAFNLMYPRAVSATYTFNGAGVGRNTKGGSLMTTFNGAGKVAWDGAAGSMSDVVDYHHDILNDLRKAADFTFVTPDACEASNQAAFQPKAAA